MHAHTPADSPITIRTLADLGDSFWLGALCQGCWRFADLDLSALVSRYGAGQELEVIARRLRCSACGARDSLLTASLAGGVEIGTVDTFSEVSATHLATLMGSLPLYAHQRDPLWVVSQAG